MNRTTENIAISNSASKNIAASNTQKPVGEKQERLCPCIVYAVNADGRREELRRSKYMGKEKVVCESCNWTLTDGRKLELEKIEPDANVSTLVNNAFVPDCTEKRPRQVEEKLTDLDEVATKEAQLMAFLGGIKIAKGYYGDPSNGKHLVTLHSYEPVLKDSVLEYIRCEFRDREKGNIWTTNISIKKLEQKLTDLSFSNKGILGGHTEDAFAILQSSFFYVWTLIGYTQVEVNNTKMKGEKKVFTYFSEKSYEGACKFQAEQRQKEADKEAEYKARKAAIADEEADAKL